MRGGVRAERCEFAGRPIMPARTDHATNKGKSAEALAHVFDKRIDKLKREQTSRANVDAYEEAFFQLIRRRISSLRKDRRPKQMEGVIDFLTPPARARTVTLQVSTRPDDKDGSVRNISNLDDGVEESLSHILGEPLIFPGTSCAFLEMAAYQHQL